ncbi:uncharacterized protein LOC128554595 [Mercenaria mercenaria]|uniref:uncharacterized protein LOC128554595 n=1 Tax=Mercenaria mercenaria TaxID=6596 RepID=UPI00234EABCC|nr:uncharacterized protein LOC128554595 [Mercenaria mercenaria]
MDSKNTSRNLKATKGSQNISQPGKKGTKVHRNDRQQTFPNEQGTHRGAEKGTYMNVNYDAGSSQSQSNIETGHEDMDTSPIGEVQQFAMQKQLQRSVEASKQMLYGVFGNVITILEEYEKREMAKYQMQQQMPKSKIPIPEQSDKSFEDVRSIVETQLLLFETQTKVCPPEAISEVLEDLKRRTISWSAVRTEKGIKEVHATDFYVTKLYEILATGKTEHPPLERQEVSEETMREGFQAMLHGDHDREKLDREFKKDKDKKAIAPETRESEMFHDGAKRISQARGKQDLDKFLQDDVETFKNQDQRDDLK